MRAVRRWFEAEGFLEVEMPARVRSPGLEVHIEAIPAGEEATTAGLDPRWLITSPEYAMKRLIGAGFGPIVSIGRCFRAGERGPHHEPEFTMVEWYRPHAPLEQIAADCEALVACALAAAGDAAAPELRKQTPDAFMRTTVRELFARHASVDLDGAEPADMLAEKLRRAGVALGSAAEWDDLFFQAWLDRIEPVLAGGPPTFVFDWPAPLGALARRHPDDPRIVERFELYAGGLELANAFGELTDPAEQRSRFESELAARRQRGRTTYDIDEALLAALPHMPPTSGIALGLDRLLMWILGRRDIRDVLTFAADEV